VIEVRDGDGRQREEDAGRGLTGDIGADEGTTTWGRWLSNPNQR
jgi:hypothetical protein